MEKLREFLMAQVSCVFWTAHMLVLGALVLVAVPVSIAFGALTDATEGRKQAQ
jgi:hypothetical protein